MNILIRPLLFLTLMVDFLPGISQVVDAGICDSSAHFPITPYTKFLRSTTPIGIDSVVKSSAFVRSENKPLMTFNYDPYYYWFRIIIKNTESKPQQLMLLMAPFGLYEGKLFQKNSGQWGEVAHTGLKYRFEDRSYQFTHPVFPFVTPPNGTDTLYLSIDATNVFKNFGFALLKPRALKMFENKIYFVFGIIVGLLILFFVLNVSLFFALKEKLHLWYAVYIAGLFLVVMKNDLLDQQFLGLDSERAFRLTPYMAIGALAIAVLMHVAQRFLKGILFKNKVLYHLTTILKVNVVISATVHALVFLWADDYRFHSFAFSWAKISTLLGICMIIVNCLYCIQKGFKGAWFILSGSFIFMLGSVQRLFFPSSLSFLFPPTTFHIGIMVETFVISMALIYRFWSEKELQRHRENQIEAQMRQEKELQRERESQIETQTLHYVSEEIHDSVGQELALANIYLRDIDVNNKTATQEKAQDARELVSDAINSLRILSRGMKNESGGSIDIADRINSEFKKLAKTRIFKINFVSTGVPFELENKKQAIIIRIIKEITQNLMKHSGATNVDVLVHFGPSMLLITVTDDGRGFDLTAASENSNGLKNISNRCSLLNASHEIKTGAGKGTRISIHIPVEGL